MKTTKSSLEFMITKPDDGKLATDETRVQRVQFDHQTLIFKAGSLEDLLRKAAEMQSLIAFSRPWDLYELDAKYDIETGEWIGRFYSIF
jgi:hypothetical protein